MSNYTHCENRLFRTTSEGGNITTTTTSNLFPMNNKSTLISDAKRKFYEQLQREFNYRQAIRDGLIERCPQTTFTISEKD